MYRTYQPCLLVALLAAVATVAAGADGPAARRGADASQPATQAPTLDQQLTDELDRELLQDLPGSPSATAKPASGPQTAGQARGETSDLDRQLLDQLGDGEDVGEKSADPFVALSRRMRTVEQLISQRKTADSTQRLQQQIVSDLALLIEQAKKQCAGGQCNNPGAAKPGAKPGGSKPGGSGDNASTKPAKDSTERLGKSPNSAAEVEAMRTLLKDVWGHLPPKLREPLQNGLAEQFLPKYEALIEAYYKRLAEERIE